MLIRDERMASKFFSSCRKIYIAEEQQKILELHHLGDVRFYFFSFYRTLWIDALKQQ